MRRLRTSIPESTGFRTWFEGPGLSEDGACKHLELGLWACGAHRVSGCMLVGLKQTSLEIRGLGSGLRDQGTEVAVQGCAPRAEEALSDNKVEPGRGGEECPVPVDALVRKALQGRQRMELVDRQRRRLRRLLAVCVVAVPVRDLSRQIQGWGLMVCSSFACLWAKNRSSSVIKTWVTISETGA